jgi:hypothetical protein
MRIYATQLPVLKAGYIIHTGPDFDAGHLQVATVGNNRKKVEFTATKVFKHTRLIFIEGYAFQVEEEGGQPNCGNHFVSGDHSCRWSACVRALEQYGGNRIKENTG